MRDGIFSTRRQNLIATGVTAAVILVGCGDQPPEPEPEPAAPPPSIILIIIDTLRADFVGSYGFDGPISPNLDALAEESVLFEKCSSAAPWTTPSMAAMMTSLYPEAHGVRLAPGDPRDQKSWRDRWTRAIPESTATLAECLRKRGYSTAGFIANPFLSKGLGFEQGFDTWDETAAGKRDRDSSPLLDAGLQWLRSKQANGDPTFLYLHMMDVHGPYTAPEADYRAVRDFPGLGEPMTLPRWGFRRIQPYLRAPEWAKGPDRNELRLWKGRYAAGLHAADRRLGEFIRTLRDDGLWNDQLVIVTSDHGEELFDHDGWDHGFSLHEHQLHVPLIVRFPDNRLAGARIDRLVRLVDLMPTLLEMTGATGPTDMVGSDLLDLVDPSGGEEPPRLAFATSVKSRPGNTSISDGRYKLISDLSRSQLRLFDTDNDPGEKTEIAARNPEIVKRLTVLLREEMRRVTQGDEASEAAGEIPQEQLERLRELGYFQ